MIPIKNVYIVLITITLFSCSTDKLETRTEPRSLHIEVTDAGFSTGEDMSSRTVEEGLATSFTGGDVIGVFTVVNGQVLQSNVSMLRNDEIDGWVGQLQKEASPDARYFAYFPWRETLNGNVNPAAETAEEFFSGVIAAWELPADGNQSTHNIYSSYDLMVGSGVLSADNLNFSMRHQMGLVLVQLPAVRYSFTNTDVTLEDYIIPAGGAYFNGVKPCMLLDGSYRYLVRPETEHTVSGGYLKDGTEHEFSANVTLQPGHYKKYMVDGGISEIREHELQAGDFYMKDGTIIAKGTALDDSQKQDCLGVVYWVGDATASDPILKNEHPTCVHALVCAMKEGDPVYWQYKNEDYLHTIQNWVGENTDGYANMMTGPQPESNMNRIMGYNNTHAMERFNDAPENDAYQLDIIDKLYDFRIAYEAPDFCSGWYVPSIKELYMMYSSDQPDIYNQFFPSAINYNMLQPLFESMGEYADIFDRPRPESTRLTYEYYYSSTEHNVYDVWCVNFGKYGYGYVGEVEKSSIRRTRYTLAF